MLSQTAKELQGYIPIPEVLTDADGNPLPRWRVRLDIDTDLPEAFGFDIYGPFTVGRDSDPDDHAFLDLQPFDAVGRGVSRRLRRPALAQEGKSEAKPR